MGIYILLWHQRLLLLLQILKETSHLTRSDRHISHNVHTHLLRIDLLLDSLTQDVAVVEQSHMLLRLKLGNRTLLGNHSLQHLLDLCLNTAISTHHHRVNLCLVVEQLLLHQLLQTLVHWVTIRSITLGTALLNELLCHL